MFGIRSQTTHTHTLSHPKKKKKNTTAVSKRKENKKICSHPHKQLSILLFPFRYILIEQILFQTCDIYYFTNTVTQYTLNEFRTKKNKKYYTKMYIDFVSHYMCVCVCVNRWRPQSQSNHISVYWFQ